MKSRIDHHAVRAAALLLLALLPALTGQALARQRIPAPPWLNRTEVAAEMINHGRLCRIVHFTTRRGVDKVVAFYRNKWAGTGPNSGCREAGIPPWRILSRLEGRWLLTVQVRPLKDGGSGGYLVETDLKKKRKSFVRIAIPTMQQSRIINDISTRDPGRKARTLLIVNQHTVQANTLFYRDYFNSQGWEPLVDQQEEQGQILGYRHGDTEARLAITPAGTATTRVVMNIVING